MMADASSLALDASRQGLEQQIAELAGAIRVMDAIAHAADAFLAA
jgi:hypothetical protein